MNIADLRADERRPLQYSGSRKSVKKIHLKIQPRIAGRFAAGDEFGLGCIYRFPFMEIRLSDRQSPATAAHLPRTGDRGPPHSACGTAEALPFSVSGLISLLSVAGLAPMGLPLVGGFPARGEHVSPQSLEHPDSLQDLPAS